MLSPGHFAAGYLVTKAVLKIIKPEFSSEQLDNLFLFGAFFGAVPDLDLSYNTLNPAKKTVNLADCRDKDSHRGHFTHAPLIWLGAGLLVFLWGFWTNEVFLKYLGLLLWINSWAHFVLDSLEDGIRWLWPFNKKFFRLKGIQILPEVRNGGFLREFAYFLKHYTKKFKLTFYLEIVLVLTALAFYFFKL